MSCFLSLLTIEIYTLKEYYYYYWILIIFGFILLLLLYIYVYMNIYDLLFYLFFVQKQ